MASDSEEREPQAYFDIYRGLIRAGIDFVVIGGQACNIWALAFQEDCPELEKEKPYSSMDVDVYSKSQRDVATAAAQFHVEPILNDPGSPAPVIGYLVLDKDESQILLQFLNNAWGIRKAEKIATSAQSVEFQTDTGPLSIKVMHPVLLLQSKISMAGKRAGKLQQDTKHVRMALLFVRAFILDTANQNVREAIKLCKAVLEIAESPDGLGLFRKLKVTCEEALPWDELKENVKLRRFLEETAVPRLAKLRKRRARK